MDTPPRNFPNWFNGDLLGMADGPPIEETYQTPAIVTVTKAKANSSIGRFFLFVGFI